MKRYNGTGPSFRSVLFWQMTLLSHNLWFLHRSLMGGDLHSVVPEKL